MTTIKVKKEKPTTWSEIKELITNGKAADVLSIGDEITDTLTTGEQVTFVVAGINIYERNQVIFSLKDCLTNDVSGDTAVVDMGEARVEKTSWTTCNMRRYLAEEILPTLPPDLLAIITPRDITTDDGVTSDYIWLFSVTEVFGGKNQYHFEPEDLPLPYYQRPASRVKFGTRGWPRAWWLRTPVSFYADSFFEVSDLGGVSRNTASGSSSICFGFCIQRGGD